MLGRMEMSTQDAISQYDNVGKDVFGKPRPLNKFVNRIKYGRILNLWLPKYKTKNMEIAIINIVDKFLGGEIEMSGRKADAIPFQSDERRCRT